MVTDIDEEKGRLLADSLEAEWRYLDVTEEDNWTEVMSSIRVMLARMHVFVLK